MKRNLLKGISSFIVFCMVLSILNFSAFANDIVRDIESDTEEFYSREIESTSYKDYEQESVSWSENEKADDNTRYPSSNDNERVDNQVEIETGEYVGEEESMSWRNENAPRISPSQSGKSGDEFYIVDGVYAIANLTHKNMWMDTQYNSVKPDHYIQQYYTTTYPTQSFTRSCLFKITRIDGTNDYVIRLMTNNRLGIAIVGNATSGYSVKTQIIPADDNEVSSENLFNIVSDGNGYHIICKANGLRLNSQSATASGSSGAPNSYLTAVSASASGNSSKWQLVPYLGEDREATNFSSSATWTNSGVEIDSHEEVFYYSYSTRIGYNHINVAIGSQYTDMADVSWNENTCIMTYTAKEIGQAITYSHISDGSNSEPIYEGYRYWRNIPTEGTYYIQNVHSSQYIDIEGPSTAEGADLQQWAFSSATQKRWIAEKVENSGGYVRFKSVYSGLYMGVNSGNTSLIEQYAAQNDYTLWKLDRTSKGNIKFICKATESSGKVLAPLNNGTSNGIDLTQTNYVNDTSYLDEWKVYPIKYSATVFNRYDYGYPVRYNETPAQSIEKINYYTIAITERLMQTIGLVVDFGGTTYYNSPIDQCKGTVTSENIDTLCAHTGDTHTERGTVLRSFRSMFPGNNTTTNILWTCHKIEGSNSCSWYNCVYIFTAVLGSERDFRTKSCLMHEICHQYGAPDHYHSIGANGYCVNREHCTICSPAPRPATCIMGPGRKEITNIDILCEGCLEDMITHLNNHHLID